MSRDSAAVGLFVVGYPTAIVVIARWIPVVRQRRLKWFLIHQAGVAAIVAGHALKDNTQGVVINGAWFVVAAAWYAARRPSRAPRAL
jgi:hypothetical protein